MSTYTMQPVEVKDVNTFTTMKSWNVINKSAQTLYFILTIEDGFGSRRFVPTGAVTVGFVKSRTASLGSLATIVTKPATVAFVGDNSLMKFDLTSAESELLVTGGLTLTVGGVPYAVPNIVKKVMGEPGF
jgi:hypothetical protein